MKKNNNIHNLSDLDREIERLRIKVANTENRLSDNVNYFSENAFSFVTNSIFCGKTTDHTSKAENGNGFFRSEKLNDFVEKVTGHITDHAADRISSLIDKLFHKKKHE